MKQRERERVISLNPFADPLEVAEQGHTPNTQVIPRPRSDPKGPSQLFSGIKEEENRLFQSSKIKSNTFTM
jgi:hypothetical protein